MRIPVSHKYPPGDLNPGHLLWGQMGSPLDQWDMERMKWDCRLYTWSWFSSSPRYVKFKSFRVFVDKHSMIPRIPRKSTVLFCVSSDRTHFHSANTHSGNMSKGLPRSSHLAKATASFQAIRKGTQIYFAYLAKTTVSFQVLGESVQVKTACFRL